MEQPVEQRYVSARLDLQEKIGLVGGSGAARFARKSLCNKAFHRKKQKR